MKEWESERTLSSADHQASIVTIGERLTIGSPRSVIVASAAFFLLMKLWWVIAPIEVMGQPRLGDDALVYLWKGAGTLVHPKADTEAARDIVSLRRLSDPLDARQDLLRARTTMRIGGVSVSPWAMFTGALLDLGFSHKATFAITETITAVVLTLGIALFLATLFGEVAAGIGMLLMSLAIFPNQGMHYLNPSVLNFGLALLMWTLVIRRSRRLWMAASLAVIMPLIHPIGFVFVAVGAGLATHIAFIDGRGRAVHVLPAILLISAGVAFAAGFIPGVQAPPTSGMGEVASDAVSENLFATGALIWESLLRQPGFWLLGMAGTVLLARERSANTNVKVVAIWVILSLIGSMAFNLPGYPAELSSRVLVWGAVCLGGVAGILIERLRGRGGVWIVAAPMVVLLCILSQAPTFLRTFFANANGRYLLYDEAEIQSDLAALPADSGVLWLNSDTLMMAALLEGGWRFSAVPFQMITRSSKLLQVLEAEWTGIIAAAPPESLNSRSAWGSWSLAKRFYGYSFSDVARIDLTAGKGSFKSIYLLLSDVSADIDVSASSKGRSCPVPTRSVVSVGANQWIVFDLQSCEGANEIVIQGPDRDVRLTGLQLSLPRPRVLWPWGEEGLMLLARPRDPDRRVLGVDFGWKRVFEEANAGELLDAGIVQPKQTLADESGIIWLSASMKPRK